MDLRGYVLDLSLCFWLRCSIRSDHSLAALKPICFCKRRFFRAARGQGGEGPGSLSGVSQRDKSDGELSPCPPCLHGPGAWAAGGDTKQGRGDLTRAEQRSCGSGCG